MTLLIASSGCAHYTVIPADKGVIYIGKGQTAPEAGWLVPDARMKDILDQLDRCK